MSDSKSPSPHDSLDSLLSGALPGYEHRESQSEMSSAVARALSGSRHLIVEAGTGTGKSLAYLVPLARHCVETEARAVVSTFTKALQRQLTEKDLPLLQKKIEPGLRYALCFGSENYLCIRRLERLRAQSGLFIADNDALDRLLEWADSTSDGIRQGSGGPLWVEAMRESDNCHSKDCPEFMRCFYQKARERMRMSHLLIVNHHLYFADLSTGRRLLPPFDAAVFDEAHMVEDVAADYLGVEVSNLRLSHILNGLMSDRGRGLLRRLKWLEPSEHSDLRMSVEVARMQAGVFFRALEDSIPQQPSRIRKPHIVQDLLSEHVSRLGVELGEAASKSPDDEHKRDLQAFKRRCEGAAASIKAVLNHELEGHVYWSERPGRSIRLVATPIDVGALNVFSGLGSAVFTSATLSTGGTFDFMRERLGLWSAHAVRLKSPFDYRKQACLYIAADMPPPNTPEYEQAVIRRITEILNLTRGRTLVLFTSHALLRRASEEVYVDGVEILRQGETDSYALVEEFKSNPHTALFGTYTFWQGIDVPGDALRCVVIARLPFEVPDEPVAEARMELLERLGRDPFMEYQVPRAAITLKQGFGRLIRSTTDRGTVAILDSRIAKKHYGKVFLDSLPDARITSELEGMIL